MSKRVQISVWPMAAAMWRAWCCFSIYRGLHGLGFKIWKSLVKSSTSKKEQQNKQWSFIIPTVCMRLGTGYRHDAQLTSAEFEVTSQCVETGMVSMNRGTVESFTSWRTKIKIPNPLTSSETITVGPRGNIGLRHWRVLVLWSRNSV